METVRRLRAMALLCRQTSAHYPDRSWKLLAEAEFWEHLANDTLRQHVDQCTASSSPPPIGDNPNTAGSSAPITA
ncbi:hypothetical protein CWO91_02505 [Bradyrhizobium genosp. SA-3]|nr:hypothetical protein CWO91_02505 [Bradyrhizobium genosp. SA-3]